MLSDAALPTQWSQTSMQAGDRVCFVLGGEGGVGHEIYKAPLFAGV